MFFVISSTAFAQEVTVTISAGDVVVKPGEEFTLNVYSSNSIALGAISYQLISNDVTFKKKDNGDPDVKASTLLGGFSTAAIFTVDGITVAHFGTSTYPASSTEQLVGQVTCVAPEEIGDYEVIVHFLTVSDGVNDYYPVVEDYVAHVKVQRAIAVKPMPENYGVQIVPFIGANGDVNLAFDYKAATGIKSMTFDVELPAGMYFIDNAEWDKNNIDMSFVASCTNTPTPSFTLENGSYPTKATISVEGTYSKKSQKYVNASEVFAPLATLNASILTQTDVDDYGWSETIMTDGGGVIKITNLVMTDIDGNSYVGGEYLATVFYGDMGSDPIVYGNYESEGARSALQTITGARTVDMTQTTGMTAESAATSLEGVYVQGATQSALMPKSKGTYRTVCVPFAVSGTGRYIISSVGESSITLSSAPETIPANTPFVATAGVVVGDESVYPNPDITHETSAGALLFKGVYKKTTINTGTYYIAKDKFWKAESEVTVAPFKAILVGSLAAKSLKIFIEDETGIREVTNQFDNEDIYNLQGIKLNKTQKGINIVGGKKVILK